MPTLTKEWLDVKDESTMYSPTLLDRGITDWELNVCPWWLEYPIGVIPKQETEMHASTNMTFDFSYVHFCVLLLKNYFMTIGFTVEQGTPSSDEAHNADTAYPLPIDVSEAPILGTLKKGNIASYPFSILLLCYFFSLLS